MQDLFTGKPTCIRGRTLPDALARANLQGHLTRRLGTLHRLSKAAARAGIYTDPDDDLVLFADDELSLLRGADEVWGELADAVSEFRATTPILPLDIFGFPADADNPFEDGSSQLRLIGGGVEAWAYIAEDASVYKFYLPREGGRIAGSFAFQRGDHSLLSALATAGTYLELFERMLVIDHLGGMPTEVVGVSPEGVLILKQTLGDKIEGCPDVQAFFPSTLVPIPASLLRAHRDHPRLVLIDHQWWFVADLHEKNFVRDLEGVPRLVDAISALFPMHLLKGESTITEWLDRARLDPAAPLLKPVSDDEL